MKMPLNNQGPVNWIDSLDNFSKFPNVFALFVGYDIPLLSKKKCGFFNCGYVELSRCTPLNLNGQIITPHN